MRTLALLTLLLIGCKSLPCTEEARAARVRGEKQGLLKARAIVSRTVYGRAVVRKLIDQEIDRLPKMGVQEFHIE